MSFLRAFLFNAPLVVLATILYGSVGILVSFFDRDGSAQTRVARAWARMLLKITSIKVIPEGLEKLQASRGYVLAANHLSYMDTPVVLAAIPVPFRFLAKRGLFKIPFLGSHLARAGHVPVPREDPRAAVKALSLAADIVKRRGVALLIFPEGGRSPDGHLQEFKDGAAYLAIKAGVPLAPVALLGTREVLPVGSAHLRGRTVRVRIGDPIDTAGLKTHDRVRLTEELRSRVAEMLELDPVKAAI